MPVCAASFVFFSQERIHQSRFEDKYNVDIMPDPETGETKMISRESENEKKRKKKKRIGEDGEEIPKKMNRKKAMKLKRKEKLAEKMVSYTVFFYLICVLYSSKGGSKRHMTLSLEKHKCLLYHTACLRNIVCTGKVLL